MRSGLHELLYRDFADSHVMARATRDASREVVQHRVAQGFEVLQDGRSSPKKPLIRSGVADRGKSVLGKHTLSNYDIQGHLNAFIIKLLLDSLEELSEQFVVAFDRSRMLTRCLRLDLCRQAIEPLPHFFGVEACFTIRNYQSRRSKVLNSRLVNGTKDGLRRLIWEHCRD